MSEITNIPQTGGTGTPERQRTGSEDRRLRAETPARTGTWDVGRGGGGAGSDPCRINGCHS